MEESLARNKCIKITWPLIYSKYHNDYISIRSVEIPNSILLHRFLFDPKIFLNSIEIFPPKKCIEWPQSKSRRSILWKKHIFNHSSSRHEKHCRMWERIFWLFQCSRNIGCAVIFLFLALEFVNLSQHAVGIILVCLHIKYFLVKNLQKRLSRISWKVGMKICSRKNYDYTLVTLNLWCSYDNNIIVW